MPKHSYKNVDVTTKESNGFPSVKTRTHRCRDRGPSRAALKVVGGWLCSENRLQPESISTKEILLDVAEKLPPDATLSDAIYELEFRQAVEQGLAELDRGEGIPIEQVKAKIAEWAGK